MNRFVKLLFCTLLTVASASAQSAATSTPEMRSHWVQVLHKLEAQPTDAVTISDAEVVFKELVEVTDFHMVICPVMGELPSKYSHKQPITQLFALGLAAYQVETGKADTEGSSLYALHSVLKGYAAILAADPKATDKKLEELSKMDAEGKLPVFLEKHGCKNT